MPRCWIVSAEVLEQLCWAWLCKEHCRAMRGSLLPRSYECKRDVARQRRALEKLSTLGTGVMQLQRVYADLQDAYLVFRWGGPSCMSWTQTACKFSFCICISMRGFNSRRGMTICHGIATWFSVPRDIVNLQKVLLGHCSVDVQQGTL